MAELHASRRVEFGQVLTIFVQPSGSSRSLFHLSKTMGLRREPRQYVVAHRGPHAPPVFVYRRRRRNWFQRLLDTWRMAVLRGVMCVCRTRQTVARHLLHHRRR